MYKNLSVIGFGLMGASLCRAVRKNHPGVKIRAFDPVETELERGLEREWIDEILGEPAGALAGDTIVVLACPPDAATHMLREFGTRQAIPGSCTLTDMVSVKESLIRAVQDTPLESRFAGSHPMAGSEKSGSDYSRPDLFEGASVLCCATPASVVLKDVMDFWSSLGARVLDVEAELHDWLVARTSHLPHLVSGLVALVAGEEGVDVKPFAGSGLADITRLAEGDPVLWSEIIAGNRKGVSKSLALFRDRLQELSEMIDSGCERDKIRGFLESARRARGEVIS
jgi:prephenate dehydrogenase